jgi:hypothetical protein
MSQLNLELRQTIAAINQAWRSGKVVDMTPYLHRDIVMKFPKFSGTMVGRDKLIAGFEEFCTNAKVLEYTEIDQQIDIVNTCAVVSFQFDMLYERPSYRERSRGRDIWVFEREADRWVAVWRTMVEVSECRETKEDHTGAV